MCDTRVLTEKENIKQFKYLGKVNKLSYTYDIAIVVPMYNPGKKNKEMY